MADYLIKGDTLKNIADAIREKNGETGSITASEMDDKIKAIPTGDGDSETLNTGTCTITITSSIGSFIEFVGCERVSSETLQYDISSPYASRHVEYNVRCDSIMYIGISGYYASTVTGGEIIEESMGSGIVYRTPSNAGANITITLEVD